MRSTILSVFCALALCLPAAAQDKDKGGGFDDLFGDSLSGAKKGGMDDLKDAASGAGAKKRGSGLVPKGRSSAGESGVQFLEAFIAERIVITKKEGCIPAGRGRVKLKYFEFNELPQASPPVSICLKMSSRMGREVKLDLTIVNARKQRVARASSVVSFTGVRRQDHVLDFPAMNFQNHGEYFVMVDIDGKHAAKLPLFNVRPPTAAPAAPAGGEKAFTDVDD
jgi:hypothetical protein